MNGSIRKRGKNSWELTIDLGYDSGGKRRRKYVSVRGTKAEAQRKLREVLGSLDKGLPVDLGTSWIIGDQASDLEAGKNANLTGGVHVLSGHGENDDERDAALALSGDGFQVQGAEDPKEAASLLPLFGEG